MCCLIVDQKSYKISKIIPQVVTKFPGFPEWNTTFTWNTYQWYHLRFWHGEGGSIKIFDRSIIEDIKTCWDSFILFYFFYYTGQLSIKKWWKYPLNSLHKWCYQYIPIISSQSSGTSSTARAEKAKNERARLPQAKSSWCLMLSNCIGFVTLFRPNAMTPITRQNILEKNIIWAPWQAWS